MKKHRRMAFQLILTCEHAGNRVPVAYRELFRDAQDVLHSHRGWDPGALQIARSLQRRLQAPLFHSTVTRLLVEPNRSPGHRQLFSEFTSGLDGSAKSLLVARYYQPYRNRVEAWICAEIERGHDVVHLSIHSFVPDWNGEVRRADLGFLYDPGRSREGSLSRYWRTVLSDMRPDLRIRCNYPYLGKADGFVTYLRRKFATHYTGIEVEVNQSWAAEPGPVWLNLRRSLGDSFAVARSRWLA